MLTLSYLHLYQDQNFRVSTRNSLHIWNPSSINCDELLLLLTFSNLHFLHYDYTTLHKVPRPFIRHKIIHTSQISSLPFGIPRASLANFSNDPLPPPLSLFLSPPSRRIRALDRACQVERVPTLARTMRRTRPSTSSLPPPSSNHQLTRARARREAGREPPETRD